MKIIIKFFSIFLITGICLGMTAQKASAQQASVSMQVFYDQLSPYGHWVHHPRHGYVWLPGAEAGVGFSPYSTNGHWRLTNDGWTWISDFSWGWAPFHYGRWDRDASLGWLWIPDTHWGPAWVNWRRDNDHFGWYPMEPSRNSSQREYNNHNDRWTFVNNRDIDRPDIHNYYIDRSKNVTIIHNTTIINNTHVNNSTHVTYNTGPRKADVEKATGQPIKEAAVVDADKPGQNESGDKVQIYKPAVTNKTNNGKKPAPAQVDKWQGAKQQKKNNSQSPQNPNPGAQKPPGQ